MKVSVQTEEVGLIHEHEGAELLPKKIEVMLTSSNNQNSSLSNIQKPIKQGWILKKGGTGVLAPWRPKYLGLFQGPGGKLTLNVYDNIDQPNPKHEIDTTNMRIEIKSVKFALLSRNAVPFTIYTRSRKVRVIWQI